MRAEPFAVDILITLFACAVNSINTKNPKKTPLHPFPNEIGFNNTDGSQDIPLLLQVIDKIPPIRALVKCPNERLLKIGLDKIHPLCFPLLKWIVLNNRTQISILPKEKQIKQMNTPLQFQLVDSLPDHEAKFFTWKEKAKKWAETAKDRNPLMNGKGSYFAFYASPVSSWYRYIKFSRIIIFFLR